MLRHVSVLVVLGIVAAATGFAREVAFAYYFGTTAAADALALALYYVEGFTVVCVTGIGGYALIPVVAGLDRSGDSAAADRLAETLWLWIGVLGVPGLVVAVGWPDALTRLVAPGFSAEQAASFRVLVPAAVGTVICLAASGVGAGVVQARSRYAGPPLGRSAFNLAIVALLLFSAAIGGVRAAAAGLLLGGVTQCAVLARAMAALGWRPHRPRASHPAMAQALSIAAPAVLTLVTMTIAAGGIQRALSSSLPEGAFSALNFANRAITLVSLFTVSFATVSMTDLAAVYQRDPRGAALVEMLEGHLDFIVFTSVPLAGWLWFSASPIVDLLFRRGRYDDASAALTSACLGLLAVGVVPGAVLAVVQRACTAVLRPWRAFAGGLAFLVVLLVLTTWLLEPLGVRALALAYSGAMVGACLGTLLLLPRAMSGPIAARLGRSLGIAMARLSVALSAAWLLTPRLGAALALPHGWWQRCVEAGLGAATIGLVYAGVAGLMGEPLLRRAASLVRRRWAAVMGTA